MRALLAAVALAVATAAAPADAWVVEVTTTVRVADAKDGGAVRAAVQSAVDDVLSDAIAFTPTLVVVTRAIVVGERLYIRLLVADQEGEKAVRDLVGDAAPAAEQRPADIEL